MLTSGPSSRSRTTDRAFPKAIQPHIFDPFFTTKPPGQGTGLGLNISHNIIVQKHKGRINVNSQPGKTRFEVRLPSPPDSRTRVDVSIYQKMDGRIDFAVCAAFAAHTAESKPLIFSDRY